MAWFWTDDLARLLVDAGAVERSQVADWVGRPVAVAGPDDADPLAIALHLVDPDALESAAMVTGAA